MKTLLPITQHSLEKLESLMKVLGFRVRFEKGNFKTGACIFQDTKVIVINKFLDLEGRIQALTELLSTLAIDQVPEEMDDKQRQLFLMIRQTKLEI